MNKHELYELLTSGYSVREPEQTHTFRGGNAGCMTPDGRIIGNDPRQAVLRFFGIEVPSTFDDQLIFDAGLRNEDHWADMLKAANVEHLREEEVPVSWQCNNYQVTGRPDIVLCNNKQPIHGIELKLISSFHTAIKVANFGDNTPKTEHLVQAAHYSAALQIPWTLAYTSRVWWSAYYGKPSKANPTGRWLVDHRALVKDDKGVPFMLKPFISLYDITWSEEGEDGRVMLLDDEPTAITTEGIKRYYAYLGDCVDNQTIPEARGGSFDYMGNAQPNKMLNYYDFKEEDTSSWDAWLESCRRIVQEKSE